MRLRSRRCSTYIEKSAGTEFHSVTECVVTASAQHCGSRLSAGDGNTKVAPRANIPKMSYTDRSKFSSEIPNIRSVGVTPRRSLTSTIVLTADSWVMATPLGVPVVPDV